MEKILIYGAGQLGVHAMSYILNNRSKGKAEVIMYSPHNYKRVEGAIEDLKDACAISGYVSNWKFKATDNVSDFKDCSIAFFCAGASFTCQEYENAQKQGIDDRMFQATKNIEILKEFCGMVKKYCPQAKIFIVTNPVDMMTEFARKELLNDNIYGLGCYLDSARFRRELFEELANNNYNIDFTTLQAWVLGHHCATMFLCSKSLLFDGIENIENIKLKQMILNALDRTRKRGLTITNINASAKTKKLNNGAYFAPAVMIADVMLSFVNNETLILPVNRKIYDDDMVGLSDFQAQMLVKIENGNIFPVFIPFSDEDIKSLEISVQTYQINKKNLLNYIEI